jgi:HEAT repeat protein
MEKTLSEMKYVAESDALKKSAWPRCDQLASGLAKHGSDALPALQSALSSRTHHVRSASLRAIKLIDEELAKNLAEKHLKDRAYEVRETAASILGIKTPS